MARPRKAATVEPEAEVEPLIEQRRMEAKKDSKADAQLDGPYVMGFTIKGRRTFYFNRADVEHYKAMDAEPSGSRRRREHNHEVLVWRSEHGELAFPGYKILRQIAKAGRAMKDPTSTGRRSAKPYIEETFTISEELCSFGRKQWDEITAELVKYANGRMGPRERPVLRAGWELSFHIEIPQPEFVGPGDVAHLVTLTGMLGIGDNLVNGNGRFVVVKVEEPAPLVW